MAVETSGRTLSIAASMPLGGPSIAMISNVFPSDSRRETIG
nr:hypothetical protein [Bosea spartocytisi]